MPRTTTRKAGGSGARIGRRLKITVVVLLGLLVLIVLNAVALDNETEKARVNVPRGQLVETTSGPLQVLDSGESGATETASPLVLIHGSGGAINWWDELIPRLSEASRVIAVDLLGYGGSAKPDSGYSIDGQAALVAQALNRVGVERAVVVGHSLGGSVATALAQGSPDLVAGIVLIDSSPDRSLGGLNGTARAARVPLLGQALWRIAPDFTLRRNLAQAFQPGYEVDDKFVEDIRAMTYTAYRDSADAGESYTDEASLPDRIASTGLPLLVIFGEEDQIFPAREALSAYASVNGVETVLIPGVGHSPQVEAPDETAEAILRFTEAVDLEAAAQDSRIRRAQAVERKAARARRGANHKRKTKSGGRATSPSKSKPDGSGRAKPEGRSGSGRPKTAGPRNRE